MHHILFHSNSIDHAGWGPTPEGNARLPLVFNINGKLSVHGSIRTSPNGFIVPNNNFMVSSSTELHKAGSLMIQPTVVCRALAILASSICQVSKRNSVYTQAPDL